MDNKKILQLAIIALITVSLATIGISAEDTGTSSEVSGGDISEEALQAMSETDKWAGFYGSIDVEFVLSDGTNNFFEWAADAQDVSGSAVYAVDSDIGDVDTSQLSEATDKGDLLDTHFDTTVYDTDDADSASETFEGSETFNVGEVNIDDEVATTEVGEDGGPEVHTWLFEQGTGEPVFATIADNNFDAFDGTADTDYQLLVAAESATTYDFYIELDEED